MGSAEKNPEQPEVERREIRDIRLGEFYFSKVSVIVIYTPDDMYLNPTDKDQEPRYIPDHFKPARITKILNEELSHTHTHSSYENANVSLRPLIQAGLIEECRDDPEAYNGFTPMIDDFSGSFEFNKDQIQKINEALATGIISISREAGERNFNVKHHPEKDERVTADTTKVKVQKREGIEEMTSSIPKLPKITPEQVEEITKKILSSGGALYRIETISKMMYTLANSMPKGSEDQVAELREFGMALMRNIGEIEKSAEEKALDNKRNEEMIRSFIRLFL